jgi:hypothetical protein
VEAQVRLVVHAVQALDHRLLELVDYLRALAGGGIDAVHPLVVDLYLEVGRPAAVATQPGANGVLALLGGALHGLILGWPANAGNRPLYGRRRIATLTLHRPDRLNAIVPP